MYADAQRTRAGKVKMAPRLTASRSAPDCTILLLTHQHLCKAASITSAMDIGIVELTDTCKCSSDSDSNWNFYVRKRTYAERRDAQYQKYTAAKPLFGAAQLTPER